MLKLDKVICKLFFIRSNQVKLKTLVKKDNQTIETMYALRLQSIKSMLKSMVITSNGFSTKDTEIY